MKQLIQRIDQAFHRYKKLLKLIDSHTKVSGVAKSVLGGLFLSFLIMLIPALIVINMFIYAKLTFFLAILLTLMVLVWPYLYYAIYYRLLKNYYPKIEEINTRFPLFVESTIIAIVLMILAITVLSIIF